MWPRRAPRLRGAPRKRNIQKIACKITNFGVQKFYVQLLVKIIVLSQFLKPIRGAPHSIRMSGPHFLEPALQQY